MFLRDALQRCSQLESEVAAVYEALAVTPAAPSLSLRAWSDAARRGRQRANLLHSLAEASVAVDDDGPFLVQVTPWISGLRRVVENARARVTASLNPVSALRCAEQLEASPRDELYVTLLEVAEPVLRRVSRLVDAEARNARRATADAPKSRDTGRARASFVLAIP